MGWVKMAQTHDMTDGRHYFLASWYFVLLWSNRWFFNSFTSNRIESRMYIDRLDFRSVYLCVTSLSIWDWWRKEGKNETHGLNRWMYVAWHSRRFSSFCHFVPECKSSAPNLMYISLCLHVALRVCLPKSPSDSHQLYGVVTVAAGAAAAVVVVIVVLSLYSMYAYIYEWNIFAWRSDFPFNFATYTCMHTERAPFQLPHLYTWHRKFSGSFPTHI